MGKAGGQLKRSFVVALLAVLLASFGVLGVSAPAQAYGEGTILALVNQARAANNLGPLRLNSAMSAVSLAWANQMAANGAMSHNPNYSSQIPGGWTRAAENVAWNYPTPTATHNAWMGSNGHRANILGDFTDIGIAFIEANGQTWAVENFGKYGASVPPPNPPSPSPSPSPTQTTQPSPSPSPSQSTPPATGTPQPSASPSSQPGHGAGSPGSQNTTSNSGGASDPTTGSSPSPSPSPSSSESEPSAGATGNPTDEAEVVQPDPQNVPEEINVQTAGQVLAETLPLRSLAIFVLIGLAGFGVFHFEHRTQSR